MRDAFILSSVMLTIGLGLCGLLKCNTLPGKLGMIMATIAICLGFVNFGWMPLFGGTQYAHTYFGFTMLYLGLGTALLSIGYETIIRKLSAIATKA